jgi:hypothetical protein
MVCSFGCAWVGRFSNGFAAGVDVELLLLQPTARAAASSSAKWNCNFTPENVPDARKVFNDAESFSSSSSCFFHFEDEVQDDFLLQTADNKSQAANSGKGARRLDFDCYSGKIILSWL